MYEHVQTMLVEKLPDSLLSFLGPAKTRQIKPLVAGFTSFGCGSKDGESCLTCMWQVAFEVENMTLNIHQLLITKPQFNYRATFQLGFNHMKPREPVYEFSINSISGFV